MAEQQVGDPAPAPKAGGTEPLAWRVLIFFLFTGLFGIVVTVICSLYQIPDKESTSPHGSCLPNAAEKGCAAKVDTRPNSEAAPSGILPKPPGVLPSHPHSAITSTNAGNFRILVRARRPSDKVSRRAAMPFQNILRRKGYNAVADGEHELTMLVDADLTENAGLFRDSSNSGTNNQSITTSISIETDWADGAEYGPLTRRLPPATRTDIPAAVQLSSDDKIDTVLKPLVIALSDQIKALE